MQFQSITITNLFSYYGENELQLTSNENCNITVLIGRNGYGKTSFINSVKMLFIDTAEEIRRTIQRKRTPTPKQFVEGIANEWWGILNQQAKQEGIKTCSVAAKWLDDEGFQVFAKRQWDLSTSYESILLIEHELYGTLQSDHKDNKAENYLEKIMPRSFLPFFFFDGEEVQAIAEANDNEIIRKMELLLNIRPLEGMQEALTALARDWRKEGQNETAKKELRDKEREREAKHEQQAIYQRQLEDLQLEIELHQDKQKKLDRSLRWLRGGVSQEAEIKLKTSIQNKEEQRDAILDELAQHWKKDAVLAVHPALLQTALKKLEGLIHSGQGEQEELLDTIRQRLNSLFSVPPFSHPKLNDTQANFYNKRIIKELEMVNDGIRKPTEESYDISHDVGKKLFNQLNQYQNNNLANNLKQKTAMAQSLWKEIHELTNKLKTTGKLSQDKQIEYQELLHQEEIVKQALISDEVKKNTIQKDLDTLQRTIHKIEEEIKRKERDLRVATEFRQQHDLAIHLKEVLEEVKNQLKIKKREELEATYNQHLSALLDSHGLIHKVVIDESFEIAYQDRQGNEIGMSTVSAGMKQLSATALLWALKDISGRNFPIIIDTPMGRIDAKHQENLLLKYYPKVGNQVILLPTDSELDKRKYELLKPYICKLYQLDNPTGRHTSIKQSESY